MIKYMTDIEDILNETYIIDGNNLLNIFLIKMKKTYAIYERISNGDRRIKLSLNYLDIPFGIETYNYKEIVNFEFKNKDTNNIVLNCYNKIKQLDNYFRTKLIEQYSDFRNKQYVSCLRSNDKYNPLLRTHIKKKSKNMLTRFREKDEDVFPNTIKGKKCKKIILEVNNLWITDSSYGLVLYIDELTFI